MTVDPRLDAILRRWQPPAPPADLTNRLLAAAAPVLAAHAARRPDWPLVARALVAALLCVPMTLAFDLALLQGLHRVLDVVLPARVSVWLTVQYAVALVVLLGLTLGAVPLLAGRATLVLEDGHA